MSVFENGVTSINFQRREDLLNARASRTTHPQTIKKLENFYSLFSGKPFTLHLPFLLKTKQEILEIIRDGPHTELISSTVSCSRTYKNLSGATHCGECFQCIDRLIATYAAKVEDWDAELYAADIINEDIQSSETRTIVVDYLRQAKLFAESNVDHFFESYVTDLSELVDYLPETKTEDEAIDLIWKLTRAHGLNVAKGIQRIREAHDNPNKTLANRSLIGLISQREHLKPEVNRLVESINIILGNTIPEMFRSVKPKDEPDFNNKVHSLLMSHELKIRTEHPTLSFACAKVIPDHLILDTNLLIEAKYIRGNTSPSKANEGMASDFTKYPQDKHILFLVYDPDHKIPVDTEFINDFESRGRCSVKIFR